MKKLIDILAAGVTDNAGLPVVSGTVSTYLAGTTQLQTIYQDWDLTNAFPNPATLDQAGRMIAFSDRRLKLVIENATGSVVRTLDNVGTEDSDVSDAALAGGASNAIPAGVMLPYGGDAAPAGYLMCDGSTQPIQSYPALYTAIGTKFNTGGEGTGTFRLPLPARRTLVGAGGSGTATLGNTVGSMGGEETHVLTVSELAAHNHSVTDPGHHHGTTVKVNSFFFGDQNIATGDTSGTPVPITTSSNTTGISIANNGSDGAHNNMPPGLVTNFIIKY